jgi:hypothetical protein
MIVALARSFAVSLSAGLDRQSPSSKVSQRPPVIRRIRPRVLHPEFCATDLVGVSSSFGYLSTSADHISIQSPSYNFHTSFYGTYASLWPSLKTLPDRSRPGGASSRSSITKISKPNFSPVSTFTSAQAHGKVLALIHDPAVNEIALYRFSYSGTRSDLWNLFRDSLV